MKKTILISIIAFGFHTSYSQKNFVQQKDGQFTINNHPYKYIGTNYWYGGLLALQNDTTRGIQRLRKELDFLKRKGITNLRVLAAAEGYGKINGNYRVGPPLQTQQGIFDTAVLYGLDVLLDEMNKRDMKAILFLSNNWEWSGGFLQYLNWNKIISDSVLQTKMEWEDMRDHISKFYTCEQCKTDYLKQVDVILNRKNSINGKRYIDDATIMSWELANEPRPMRATANDAYKQWIANVAAYIKSKDENHLVCLGHEGEIGTQDFDLYKQIHADKNIDYLTIHIWPKNWGWMNAETMQTDFAKVDSLTSAYINKHLQLAGKLNKPLVIEEFGFPRDKMQFTSSSPTTLRDKYYAIVFSFINSNYIGGINFWSFNGIARPKANQLFWKPGDDFMGDPPMEEQSLYGVFDSDESTWKVITKAVQFAKN